MLSDRRAQQSVWRGRSSTFGETTFPLVLQRKQLFKFVFLNCAKPASCSDYFSFVLS